MLVGLNAVVGGAATANRDPTGAIFVTYVVTPASPSVYCQGNLTSRLSEEGSSTPEPTSHSGGSSLVLGVLATSTDHGCDVVIEDVRVAMAANDRDPRGNPEGSTMADGRGLWAAKSADAGADGIVVGTANFGTEANTGGAVQVGPYASESLSPGVGTVEAEIVFSIGAPGDSVGVGSNAVGDGVGTSFGTAQLTLQRPVQLTLQQIGRASCRERV